jgi:glutathionylspermidine synthase
MQRHRSQPRSDWPARVAEIGLTYHSHEHGPYWDESACYELSAKEVEALETAGSVVHRLCIDAAEAVIERGWWSRLAIPQTAIPTILRSWENDEFSLYGRFDFAFDGTAPPKLLEYNADTPTALVEAAVAQWFWLQETRPEADQFNSLHERLIEAWRRWAGTTIHFSSLKDQPEDEQTVLYLRDTCEQAGVATASVAIEDLGWDSRQQRFVDLDGNIITHCFKLYPWEWLWHEEFAGHLSGNAIQLIEPCWKMLLSNKGLLPILWELFPDHPNLLPAFETPQPLGGTFVRKPKLSREGSNVLWVERGQTIEETPGDYGEEGHVFQAPANIPSFDGHHPVFGVWMVDHEPAGLGIREDHRRVTGNLSRFVPHFFPPRTVP